MKILKLPEITLEVNAIQKIQSLLSFLKPKNILIVTDKGIVGAGILDKVINVIDEDLYSVTVFDNVEAEPDISFAKKVLSSNLLNNIECVIALGGGSCLDFGKILSIDRISSNDITSIIGIDAIKNNTLPLIAIPTTAGTGSEVTPIAILSDKVEKVKKGIVSSKIIPDYALLDPSLQVDLPPKITSMTGVDALVHAIEAYASVNASDYTDMLAVKSMELISENLERAYIEGYNLEARLNMLRGSLYAGIAFANAGVAAVHAFAYPLGAMYNIPHGLANALMLKSIVEFNSKDVNEKYTDIAKIICQSEKATVNDLLYELNRLFKSLKISPNLKDEGVLFEDIPKLAKNAITVTRLLSNNPRKIELEDAINLYIKAYE